MVRATLLYISIRFYCANFLRFASSAFCARGRGYDYKRREEQGCAPAGADEVRHRDIRYHSGSGTGRRGSMGTEMLVVARSVG